MTGSREHNLQIQVNRGTTITTLKKLAPKTIAGPVLVPSGDPWPPSKIRDGLRDSMLI